MNKSTPPYWAKRFFGWYCKPHLQECILGDLEEQFEEDLRNYGSPKARRRFVWNVIRFFRKGITRKLGGTKRLNVYGMFKHNLKITYRSFLRRKAYTAINLGGLLIGLSVSILIVLWAWDEFSFNKEHESYDRIARVLLQKTINQETKTSWTVPFVLAGKLQKEYSDDFENVALATWFGEVSLAQGEKTIAGYGGYMSSCAPAIMSLNMLKGDRESLPANSAFLSNSLSKALFGDKNPIGEVVETRSGKVSIAGVFEDIPANNTFHKTTFVGNWNIHESSYKWKSKTSWTGYNYRLFVQLKESTDRTQVSHKISDLVYENTSDEEKRYKPKLLLHPMKDWHLYSNWKNGVRSGGKIKYVWWVVTIGMLILVLACVNFMNLSTAQSIKRAKEVGISKSIGKSRFQLILQFLTESVLFVFISFLLASIVVVLLLPYVNEFTDKEIPSPIPAIYFWIYGVFSSLIIGILAGSYPAFYLSSFSPIKVLKGTFQNKLSAVSVRKILVVFQFTIAVALVTGTMFITRQIKHTMDRSLGYIENGIITVPMKTHNHWAKSDVIENELLASGAITHFTQSSGPLTAVWTHNDDISWEGMDTDFIPQFCTFWSRPDFGETIGWEIIEGRDFSSELKSDSLSIIINETALEYMQLSDPIGKSIKWGKEFKIIGVVKDLLVESPFQQVKPTLYKVETGWNVNKMLMRINSKIPTLKAIATIEEIYKKHVPKVSFQFDFVSEIHDDKFKEVNRISSITQILAALAIIISCLGMLGLASFMAEQRTKEIGIRKVLGASIVSIWKLLSREFLSLVSIACLVSIPITFYFVSDWLQAYQYRIKISWWIFALCSIISIVFTLAIISFKSLKVALCNPVETLKDE